MCLSGQIFTFSEAAAALRAFEGILCDHGITVVAGSAFGKAADCLRSFETYIEKPWPIEVDIRRDWSAAISLADLCQRAVRLKGHADFSELVRHFSLLNSAKQPAQNLASVINADSDKLFELFIALLGMDVGSSIKLDDPNHSQGDNPDILLNIDGVRWGIACKVPHTGQPLTFWDSFKKGLKQIHDSEAETGFVIFNTKNLTALDEIWPLAPAIKEGESTIPSFSAWHDYVTPSKILCQKADDLMSGLIDRIGKETYVNVVSDFNAVHVPIFLFYSGTGLLIEDKPTLGCLRQLGSGGQLFSHQEQVLHRFIAALDFRPEPTGA